MRSHVSIVVYDVLGKPVRTLYEGEMNKRTDSIYWHGKDNIGNQVPTGLYFVILQAASVNKISKLILLR